MRFTVWILGLLATVAPAQHAGIAKIQERFAQAIPDATELAFYRLDWSPSLEAARERARDEERPILLVVIHAQYGDLRSGHC